MFELIGIDGLTQWDVGRQVNVDKDVDMVHFSNRPYGYSKNVKVTDGVADVPDMFLTSCAPLHIWAYIGNFEKGYTKIEKIYEVKPKNRPEDYIYTPEEVKTWEKLQDEIGDLADLATKAKENLVAAINEVAADMSEGVALDTTLSEAGKAADAKAVGDALAEKQSKGDYLTQDNLQSATDAVLAQAKASGEFDGADGKSAYQYAQDGGYTGTETEFAEKLAKEIPEALPNPNALTLTGAVNATYDGSTAVSVEIPSGGSSGTDISLGLTSAAVGQIIKVKAVDESGKPTAWEAADMPSGGGAGLWEHICDITATEEIDGGITISENREGVPLSELQYNEIWVLAKMVGVSTNTNNWWGCTCGIHQKGGNVTYRSRTNGASSGGTTAKRYVSWYTFIRGGKAYWTDGANIDPYDMAGGDQVWLDNFLDQYTFDYFTDVTISSDSTHVIGVDTEIRILGRRA